jgi:hypothetical protein
VTVWTLSAYLRKIINFEFSVFSFYLFVCSICNGGSEFLHRLCMRLEEALHVVMYNLTQESEDKSREFNLCNDIIPFFLRHLDNFRISERVSSSFLLLVCLFLSGGSVRIVCSHVVLKL